MNPESDFRIESTYDRQADQAMAKEAVPEAQDGGDGLSRPDQRGFGDRRSAGI